MNLKKSIAIGLAASALFASFGCGGGGEKKTAASPPAAATKQEKPTPQPKQEQKQPTPQKQEQAASAWHTYDDGALTVRWKMEKNSATDKIVTLEFKSKSREKFSLGWVDNPQFILTTEKGDFPTKEVSPRITNFNRKFDMSPLRIQLAFRGTGGAAQSLLITDVLPLHNGLPSPGGEGIDVTIDLTEQ